MTPPIQSTVVTSLMLVHGWGGSASSWSPLSSRWPSAWSIQAVDLPGHGARADETPFTVRAAADVVIGCLEQAAADRPAVLIGHSMGGQITALVHTERPELVTAEIVIDPAYGHPVADLERLREWWERIGTDPHRFTREFVSGAFTDGTSNALRASILAQIDLTAPSALSQYLYSEYLAADSIGMAPASTALLSRRTRPTLGVYSNAGAAGFESANGTADTVVWPDGGHYLHLEHPRRFVSTVHDWLNRRGCGR